MSDAHRSASVALSGDNAEPYSSVEMHIHVLPGFRLVYSSNSTIICSSNNNFSLKTIIIILILIMGLESVSASEDVIRDLSL